MIIKNINFLNLGDSSYRISSSANFDTVCKWMDNRFWGLPFFHESVIIKVKKFDTFIEGEFGALKLPEQVYKITSKHLIEDLKSLINFIQRDKGVKSFGLLHLSIKLPQHLLNKEFKKLHQNKFNPFYSISRFFGSRVSVPMVLAIASRKTDSYYESLAVGVNGVSRYYSILNMESSQNKSEYIVRGNIESQVYLKHVSFPFKKLFSKNNALPENFFNTYLNNYLKPEREKIVRRLCEYVFKVPIKFTN